MQQRSYNYPSTHTIRNFLKQHNILPNFPPTASMFEKKLQMYKLYKQHHLRANSKEVKIGKVDDGRSSMLSGNFRILLGVKVYNPATTHRQIENLKSMRRYRRSHKVIGGLDVAFAWYVAVLGPQRYLRVLQSAMKHRYRVDDKRTCFCNACRPCKRKISDQAVMEARIARLEEMLGDVSTSWYTEQQLRDEIEKEREFSETFLQGLPHK